MSNTVVSEIPTLFGRPLPVGLLILCSITMALKLAFGIYTIQGLAGSFLILLGCFMNMFAILVRVLSILRKSVSCLQWSMLFSFLCISAEVGINAAVLVTTRSEKFNQEIQSACDKLLVNNHAYNWLFQIQQAFYDSKYYTDVKNSSASSTAWCAELPGKVSTTLLIGVAISFVSILVQILTVWKSSDYISFLKNQQEDQETKDVSLKI